MVARLAKCVEGGIGVSETRKVSAGILIGLGLAAGFPFLAAASLIVRENISLEILERLNGFWAAMGGEE